MPGLSGMTVRAVPKVPRMPCGAMQVAGLRARGLQLAPVAVAVAALAFYANFILLRAINVPWQDDILDVLGFLLRFADGGSLAERAAALFAPHTDHRTTTSRIVYLAAWCLQGRVDFRTLTLVSNLSVPILIGLYSVAMPRGSRLLTLALAALVLCQPRAREFLLWPMSVLAFQGVMLYGFACILALERLAPWRFALAAVLGAAAMCSLSSGQFVWLAGATSLGFACARREPRAWWYLGCWLVVASAALWLFRADMPARNPLDMLLETALSMPGHHVLYLVTLLGSAFSFGNPGAAAVLGTMALAITPFLSVVALRRGHTTLVVFCWYLLLCMAAIVLGRAPYSVPAYALEGRYSVASLNFSLCLALLALAAWRPGRRAWYGALGLAACFSVASYRVFVPLTDVVMRDRVAAFNSGTYRVFGQPTQQVMHIVDEAVRRGLYAPPSRPMALPAGG